MSSPKQDATDKLPSSGGWSLRRRLLISHALFVALAVLALGTASMAFTVHAAYRQAEADLLGAAQLMLKDLEATDDGAPPAISDLYLHRFGKAPRDRAYLAIWDADSRMISSTQGLPAHATPADRLPPTRGPHPFATRSYGANFEVLVATPQGGQLLIGRPLAKEFDRLRSVLWELLACGGACLMAGVGGAWWLSRRIAAPLAEMSETAERITSRNTSQRLDAEGAADEIARLAFAFNGMLDRLSLALEQQARFTADASHELRTPVSVVLSQAEFALSRERSIDEYRAALQTCLASARRMQILIDSLLFLASADAGQQRSQPEPADLSMIARRAVELLRPLALERNVRLATDLTPAIVVADSVQMEQVVTNLTANAIAHSAAGDEVRVAVRPTADREALLIVSDDGAGIAAEDQPRIFDRFFRGDRARTPTGHTGTGLGLCLVWEIVTAHRGRISIDSALGRGTTMSVLLPAASRDE